MLRRCVVLTIRPDTNTVSALGKPYFIPRYTVFSLFGITPSISALSLLFIGNNMRVRETSKGSQHSAEFCSLPDTDSRWHRINGEASTKRNPPFGTIHPRALLRVAVSPLLVFLVLWLA